MTRQPLAPLRVGVVGCGAVAERYHLPALLASSAVRVVAVADRSIDRAREFAAHVPGARAVADHRELVGIIDLALVATPNASHESIGVDLLEAGVHALIEKPMARTADECDRLCAAAARSGAVLAVGQDFRFFPVAQFAHQLFASGMLGPIRHVDVRQSAGIRWPCVSPAALNAESGGGVLLSFGVHTLDLLLWWLGDLTATGCRDDAVGGVEAECELELRLGNGAPVHVKISRRRTLRDTAVIHCERGVVELAVFEPALIRLTVNGTTPVEARVPDEAFERAPLRTVFARQLHDVVDAIRHGRAPVVDGTDGRRVVALVESCYAVRQPLRRSWDYPEVYASIPNAVSV